MSSWKRWGFVTVTTALAALALGSVALSSACAQDDLGDAAPQKQYNTERPQSEETRLQGTGRQASQKFQLEPGLAIFEATHDGTSNLVIRLLDEKGNDINTLFNEIGAYNGEQAFAIPKGGRCLLDVAADGNWTVAIRQPRPIEGQALPTTLQGSGSDVTPFIQLDEGLVVFKMKHNGEARFRITLRDQNGQPVESLVNTLGAFEGSKPLSIEKSGIYFLNVGADGDWSVDAE